VSQRTESVHCGTLVKTPRTNHNQVSTAKRRNNQDRLACLSRPARPLPRRDFFPRGAREAGQTTALLESVHSAFQGATLCRLALAMHADEIVSRSCTISSDPALEEITIPRPSSARSTFPQRSFCRIAHRGFARKKRHALLKHPRASRGVPLRSVLVLVLDASGCRESVAPSSVWSVSFTVSILRVLVKLRVVFFHRSERLYMLYKLAVPPS
jgi:hypothetical protein